MLLIPISPREGARLRLKATEDSRLKGLLSQYHDARRRPGEDEVGKDARRNLPLARVSVTISDCLMARLWADKCHGWLRQGEKGPDTMVQWLVAVAESTIPEALFLTG